MPHAVCLPAADVAVPVLVAVFSVRMLACVCVVRVASKLACDDGLTLLVVGSQEDEDEEEYDDDEVRACSRVAVMLLRVRMC